MGQEPSISRRTECKVRLHPKNSRPTDTSHHIWGLIFLRRNYSPKQRHMN